MANDQFNAIQAEINAALQTLKTTKDPVKRRELLVAVRKLITALEKLVGPQRLVEKENAPHSERGVWGDIFFFLSVQILVKDIAA